MYTSKLSAFALILSLCALFFSLYRSAPPPQSITTQTSTHYDRIMKTRTVRCAYFSWRPFIMKDPNTGTVSGFIPDILAQIGHDLNLKFDYVEDVNIAQMFEGFSTDRYDAVCGPVTPTVSRTTVSDFIKPVGYASMDPYVRIDDHRFDQGVAAIDKPEVKITAIEGEASASVVALKFPSAKLVTLPNISDNTQLLMELTSGKADIVIVDTASAKMFMASHPNKIRKIEGIPPILLSGTLAIPTGEFKLKSMLDSSVDYLVSTGFISAMARKYGVQGMFYLPSIPHEDVK
ncbi:MAG: transporter substrate-binding domain-containing protein [Proteobacteria bacterium]|nr:transporter substrate-binding domain-containing protein [Pseudomonadota bacterium]